MSQQHGKSIQNLGAVYPSPESHCCKPKPEASKRLCEVKRNRVLKIKCFLFHFYLEVPTIRRTDSHRAGRMKSNSWNACIPIKQGIPWSPILFLKEAYLYPHIPIQWKHAKACTLRDAK
jgi:hypothetical protein